MSGDQRTAMTACESASVAVEFAIVLPVVAMAIVATLFAGTLAFSAASLNDAVEQAARCYALGSSQCSSASTTQAYAQSRYRGISHPTFTATILSCGYQVTGTLTFPFDAAEASWAVPLNAIACSP
jgi:Flp pilus assembly protein TadG